MLETEPDANRSPPMRRKIAAIVAADVAGYSRLVAEDEEETVHRLGAFREVYDDFIRQYGGRIFNTAGDAVLSEFESAVQAVRAAIDIQDALRTRNFSFEASRKLQFRIGISIGDVIERNGDLLGDGVNIAARLEGLAEAGGICVSRSVHEAVANKISVPFRYLGERQVKNIPQPVAAFAVAMANGEGDGPDIGLPPASTAARSALLPWIVGAGAAVVLVAAAVGAWLQLSPSHEMPRTAGNSPSEASARPAPQGARDLYQQARTLEGQGRTAEARQAYDGIERMGLELIDPALHYAALLRVQDGRAAAREVFADLERDRPTRTSALVHALQFDGPEQASHIAALVARDPGFAPAQYWLGEQFSEDRLGRAPTLAERATARAAYAAFLEADRDGTLTPYFIDLSELSTWLDRARGRQRELGFAVNGGSTRPTAQFTRSNDGWTAVVMLPEPALSLSYRIGDSGDFKETGDGPAADPRTGKPFPNLGIALPPETGPTTLEVRYTDASGHLTEPVAIAFDPRKALYASEKQALDMSSNSWLAFRADMPELLYFTQLVVFRCAIKQAVFGLDDAPVERVLPLPACDERNPYTVPSGLMPYVQIPTSTRKVSIRLTYADGEQSDVKTMRR